MSILSVHVDVVCLLCEVSADEVCTATSVTTTRSSCSAALQASAAVSDRRRCGRQSASARRPKHRPRRPAPAIDRPVQSPVRGGPSSRRTTRSRATSVPRSRPVLLCRRHRRRRPRCPPTTPPTSATTPSCGRRPGRTTTSSWSLRSSTASTGSRRCVTRRGPSE